MEPDITTAAASVTSGAPETKENAPSSLAEPAGGPDTEMSGALDGGPTSDPTPVAAPEITSSEATEKPSASNTDSASAPAPPATEHASEKDTEMKDATDDATAAPIANPEEADTGANGTPATKKNSNGRRKSGGIPEHKNKKLNKKKSFSKATHLDAQPGEFYFARLKSYPPWPSIICDEDMLPESLLTTRPITTKKDDGTYNEAYADDGKRVTERTFPVMFLYTNEFAFIPNTDLTPLTPEECKDVAEKGKGKALIAAYGVAAEGHDLAYFKEMLSEHADAMAAEDQRREELAAEKAAKADKKKRKSEVKTDTEDVEMGDAEEAGETKKSSKKRKKVAESDDEEPEKPAKTPKTTKLKLTTNKTPATAEKKTKEKVTKPRSERKKSKAAASDEDLGDAAEEEPEKPMDPEEARKARGKEVLFLRHRLQKGFLSRDSVPQEEDMPQMSNYVRKLENYEDLEVSIIRETKINKVLKALVKLTAIPKDEEFNFRKRSVELLGKWNKILGADPTDAEPSNTTDKDSKSTPTINGVHEDPELPAENEAKTAEAVEKISEVDADAGAKATVIESLQEESKQPTVEDGTPAVEPAPAASITPAEKVAEVAVVEKAPESAEGAAEARETVKLAE